jgi:hypothetical protein
MSRGNANFALFIIKNRATIMNDEDTVLPEEKKGVSASSDYTKL